MASTCTLTAPVSTSATLGSTLVAGSNGLCLHANGKLSKFVAAVVASTSSLAASVVDSTFTLVAATSSGSILVAVAVASRLAVVTVASTFTSAVAGDSLRLHIFSGSCGLNLHPRVTRSNGYGGSGRGLCLVNIVVARSGGFQVSSSGHGLGLRVGSGGSSLGLRACVDGLGRQW